MIWNQMREMDRMFDTWLDFPSMNKQLIKINMDDMGTFKNSIESFQKQHPNAKIKASAYVYSTGTSPQMFKYETKEEKSKLKPDKSIVEEFGCGTKENKKKSKKKKE